MLTEADIHVDRVSHLICQLRYEIKGKRADFKKRVEAGSVLSYLHPYAVVKQLIEVEHPVHAHVHPEVEVMGAWDQIKAPFFGRGSLLGTA